MSFRISKTDFLREEEIDIIHRGTHGFVLFFFGKITRFDFRESID